eukprot:PhF_6_TR8472/c0_g1_i1/m.13239
MKLHRNALTGYVFSASHQQLITEYMKRHTFGSTAWVRADELEIGYGGLVRPLPGSVPFTTVSVLSSTNVKEATHWLNADQTNNPELIEQRLESGVMRTLCSHGTPQPVHRQHALQTAKVYHGFRSNFWFTWEEFYNEFGTGTKYFNLPTHDKFGKKTFWGRNSRKPKGSTNNIPIER